jgi:hypothetical protein
MSVETNGRRITRGDLQSAFSRAIGEGRETVRTNLPPVALIAGAVAVGVIAVSYWLGRRGGRNDSAIVEIRRL